LFGTQCLIRVTTCRTDWSAYTEDSTISDIFAKCKEDGGYFGPFRVQGDNYFTQPILEGPAGPHMIFRGKPVLIWSLNSYLGLTGNEEIRAAVEKTLNEYSTGSPMGSRMLTGNTPQHIALEERFADYMGKEAAMLWNYGYMGVLGVVAALVGEGDTVIVDALSHASIYDATFLCRGERKVFKHNDVAHLDDRLRRIREHNPDCGILVVTEGVYGMTGDLAPLPEICEVKDKYGARFFIDDAHGFGIMGENGIGAAEHLGCQDKIDLHFGTFAKGFAAIGGVTGGPKDVIDYIRYNARTNVFAKSTPMVYVTAIGKALEIMIREPERRARMWEITHRLQNGLREVGFDLGNTGSPVTPVYVPAGDVETGMGMIKILREEFGIFVSGVMYPVVPKGTILFRLIPTAAHTEEDVDRTIDAFAKMGKTMGVI